MSNLNGIIQKISDFTFFQIDVIADIKFEGKVYKNVKQRNNDSILKPENWEKHKQTFFEQRMSNYKDSYTLTEKINLELDLIKKLSINETDYKILKDRYNVFLKSIQIQFQQTENNKFDEKYKAQILFKVGLLFAKGEMNKYFTVNSKNSTVMNSEYTAPKIAKELGNDRYNKYILASINNYTDKENGNKNIFNSLDMMTKIISHCKTENIPVDTYFSSRLPIE
jgi:hypothetical protein